MLPLHYQSATVLARRIASGETTARALLEHFLARVDAHNPALKAGVAWYGRLVGNATPLTPAHPVDLAGKINVPVLGLYGGQDPGIPLDTVDKMKWALAQGSGAARKSEFVVYPDAPHAFHADYRPSFRKAEAADGWQRCLAWFKAQGVA